MKTKEQKPDYEKVITRLLWVVAIVILVFRIVRSSFSIDVPFWLLYVTLFVIPYGIILYFFNPATRIFLNAAGRYLVVLACKLLKKKK